MDLQFYTERVVIESEANTSLVTVSKVDLSEIAGQIPFREIAEYYEYGDVMDYYSIQGDD